MHVISMIPAPALLFPSTAKPRILPLLRIFPSHTRARRTYLQGRMILPAVAHLFLSRASSCETQGGAASPTRLPSPLLWLHRPLSTPAGEARTDRSDRRRASNQWRPRQAQAEAVIGGWHRQTRGRHGPLLAVRKQVEVCMAGLVIGSPLAMAGEFTGYASLTSTTACHLTSCLRDGATRLCPGFLAAC